MSDGPAIRITHSDNGERSRAAVFFRLLLIIPHAIWLFIWTIGAVIVAPVHWVIALIRGEPATWAHNFYSAYVRYVLHVYSYLCLAADRYPGFSGDPGYVVDAEFPPPGPQPRWKIALRVFIALPALFLASALSSGLDGGYSSTRGSDDAQAAWGSLGGLGASIAILAWFASLALARTPAGLRDAQVYCQGYAAQAYGYLLLLSDCYPTSDPDAIAFDPMPPHPVRLRVAADDGTRNRLTVFFRLILVIPYLLWIALWAIAVFFAAIVGWFAALIAGRLPDGLHSFFAAFVRLEIHTSAFLYLLGDSFPGFLGRAGSYPVDPEIDDPRPQDRAKTAFRIILAIPAWFVAGGFGTVALLAAIGGWFCVLFTGRMPAGLRGLIAWAVRYAAQTYSYSLLLTDRYPYTGPDGRGRVEPEPPAAPETWQVAPERP